MKTFLKVCLVLFLAVIAVHVLPAVAGPLGFILAIGLVLLSAFCGVVALMLGLAALVLVLTSPLWLPVFAVAGLIALLCRKSPRAAA